MVIHFLEGAARNYMPVIVAPSPNHRIKGSDHIAGFHGRELPDCFPDLHQERLDFVPGRFYEQLPFIFTWVLPQEVKSVLYPRNPGFLW